MKIYVAGHNGMVGSAIVRQLIAQGCKQVVVRSRKELDLTKQERVNDFFASEKPDQVYLAAAKVGGIYANNIFPANFIYENLMIEANIIQAAFCNGVRKLLFLGSSCIYPKYAEQPMSESSLLTGILEPTNEPYAVAKIAGIKLCESYNRQYGESHGVDFRSVMPTNLYGPGDNYHPVNSHVIPALIRKFYEAKVENLTTVTIWGTGTPKREFLHVDDMASACIHVMNLEKLVYEKHVETRASHINIGTGKDISISDLALLIKNIVGYKGDIIFDSQKPNGAPRKLLDTSLIQSLGWKYSISLENGLRDACQDYESQVSTLRNS